MPPSPACEMLLRMPWHQDELLTGKNTSKNIKDFRGGGRGFRGCIPLMDAPDYYVQPLAPQPRYVQLTLDAFGIRKHHKANRGGGSTIKPTAPKYRKVWLIAQLSTCAWVDCCSRIIPRLRGRGCGAVIPRWRGRCSGAVILRWRGRCSGAVILLWRAVSLVS